MTMKVVVSVQVPEGKKVSIRRALDTVPIESQKGDRYFVCEYYIWDNNQLIITEEKLENNG